MEYSENKIARNTSLFTLALVLQKLISFIYFSYIAVKLGAGNLGSYTFALSFTTIFAVFIDLGLANVLIREAAKFKDKCQQYLGAVMALKIPLALLTYTATIIAINFLSDKELVRQLVYLSGLIMLVDSFTLTFYAFLRGRQNLQFEAIGTIIFQLIVFISGVIIVNLTQDLRILILAILIASLFNFIYSGILLKVKLGLKFFKAFDKSIIKSLVIFTIPFALAAIFTKVYAYIDTVFLHQLAGPEAVGYYSLPYKLTFSLQFIPMAFIASLYPAFSSYFVSNKQLLAKYFARGMVYLGLIAMPVTFGVIAIAQPLIFKIYTAEYLPSVLALQILISSLPFLFLNFPLGALLNACDRQTRNTINIGITMVVNIILNLILIPRFSFIGAAIASSVSTVLMFVLQMIVAKQIVVINYSFLLKKLGVSLLAGLAMYLYIIYLLPAISFIVLVPIGALIYLLILWLFKGISKEEVVIFLQSVFKRV
jgi:O-antigen/teichoic acid export membrane protein